MRNVSGASSAPAVLSDGQIAALTSNPRRAKILDMMNSRNDDPLHSSSLITYIGYITGPRAEQPTGVRVVEPPPGTRQHQRGNLYAVVELSGEHPDRAAIADRLLSDLQRTYYSAKGSQSQVMIDALQQAQQSLREVNAHSPYFPLRAGLMCAALLNGKLLVVASGSAFALIRANDKVHMFPSELSLSGGGASLASSPVEIFRQDVDADDAFFLGGAGWLREVPVRTLAGVVAFINAENCSDAADELFDQGGQIPHPGLLIVLATNHEPPRPGTSPTGPGGTPPRPRRPKFSGGGALPTALSTQPPAHLPPASPAPAAARVGPALAVNAATQPAAKEVVEEPVQAPAPEDEPVFPPPAPPSTVQSPEGEAEASAWPVAIGAAATAGMRQARTLFTRMLPDRGNPQIRTAAFAPLATVEDEEVATAEEDSTGARTAYAYNTPVREPPPVSEVEPLEAASEAEADEEPLGDAPEMPTPVLDLPAFVPPPPARGARARLFLLVALLIVLLVPAVVGTTILFNGWNDSAEAAQLTDLAQSLLYSAQTALDNGDKVSAREQLTEGKEILDQAIALAGANDLRSQLEGEIQTELNEVLQIVPLYGLTTPLITFPPEARPRRVLVADEDIYVLDAGRQAVYRYEFDPTTRQVVDEVGQVVLQQDTVVDGVPVGPLADIAWLPLIPGYEDRPSLLVIDRNNNLFRYDHRVEGARRVELAGQQGWGTIGQIETYDTRMYIADEGTGALYRYDPGQVDVPPGDWFADQTQVNLAGMVSLGIDGDVWFLFSNGMILRYQSGEQVPFSPENSIGLAEEPVDMYVARRELDSLFIVDAGEDRILVYDKNGAYLRQLVAPEDNLLRGLAGLHIDEVGSTMYILTQSGLYLHPVVQ
jgi:hypothetical protein